ncbi:MAG TPA: MFS transporter [Steroidobacteraceae bacterium]|jgi:predicted MFS family arabinose efflux permease|nr:MFS transporter [Steroidobacteraceae bacterium]
MSTTIDRPGSGAAAGTSSVGYQVGVVALLSITFGILFFDRNALGFLQPFVQPDLGLSNTQVGLLASVLSLTWAFAAFGIGVVSDRTGSRKRVLLLSTVAFSVCSVLSGLAGSFVTLLAARALMGIAEGGIMPIAQAIIASEVKPEHRGLAMGVTQNFGSNLLGSFVAPLALTGFATAFGWRHAFYLAGLPGLVAAVVLWRYLREPRVEAVAPIAAAGEKMTLLQALEERNILICTVMSILLVSFLVVCWNFMPLYLTKVRGYDPQTESWLMSTLGISATVGAFAISALSDRIGRRPLMIAMPFIGVVLPLGAMYFNGSAWILACFFFIGWGLNGIFPLFMATIPSESVDPKHRATVLGLCMGSGELIGGAVSPYLAGAAADHYGQQAPLWLMLGVAVLAGICALGLRETAPRVVNRSKSVAAMATH